MLKKVLLALAVFIVGLCAVVASRPSTFHIERSTTLAAPAKLAFALVNDFHSWKFWSPWEAMDPQMKKTFDGPYAGPGAIYAWKGDKAGAGKMTILESQLYERIQIQLDFLEPWPASNTATFTFQPTADGGTTVRWAMDGHNNFGSKLFSLFMDMDAMVGKDFEKGLAGIKTLAEQEAKKRQGLEAQKAAAEAAAQAPATETPAPAQAATTTP